MKRWGRVAWLLVSGAWFIRLQMIPVLQWASFPTFSSPRGLDLWVRVLRDWRHSWLFFATVGILVLGLLLEIAEKQAAAFLNVGFYVVYLLRLTPSLIAVLRNKLESEAVIYLSALGQSALLILIVNYLLYRSPRKVRAERHE
jgi:hypothetical protein